MAEKRQGISHIRRLNWAEKIQEIVYNYRVKLKCFVRHLELRLIVK